MVKKSLWALILTMLPSLTWAFSNHAIITYLALSQFTPVTKAKPVIAESLSDFVTKERNALEIVLKQNEQWARKHCRDYPPLPKRLRFHHPSSMLPLRTQFLQSIRVNPRVKIPLYIHSIAMPSAVSIPKQTRLEISDVSLVKSIKTTLGKAIFVALSPGEKISVLSVITSASDEPDYGFDVGLWNDNATTFGRRYHWGDQPFGDPRYLFNSQAPFHMAFWHEVKLAYLVAPYLHRTYPEYRLHTYLMLSRLAFKTHHDYWGWRFLGWAIHYVQDLGQPYHATMTPGENILKVIFYAALKKIGLNLPVRHLIQCLANRHLLIESYIARDLNQAIFNQRKKDPLFSALLNHSQDAKTPPFHFGYLREVVSVSSHDRASTLDQQIKQAFPRRYTLDPNYTFERLDTKSYLAAKQKAPLNTSLPSLLEEVGAFTRAVVVYERARSPQIKTR